MLEPWRSRYLHALGVDVYQPRFPLPAAAPSPEMEWDDEIALEADLPVALNEQLTPTVPARHLSSPAALLDVESVGPRSARNASTPSPASIPAQKPANHATPALRIKLMVAASDSGMLIVDDATNTARNDSQRLLANLVFALQRKPVSLKHEAFDWPLPNLRNRAIELNEDAARETLSGLLQRKIVDGNVQTVLLLGEDAQRWIDAPLRERLGADRSLTWGISISALTVLSDLQLKRQWWLDLQNLATH